jgi:RimJ/RimL family protein N-acetyltransferase
MKNIENSGHAPLVTNEPPVLETLRLRLRPHDIDDLAASLVMWVDPFTTRFIGGKPATEQSVWARLLNYAGHWSLMGYGYWVVELKETGQFIGEVGFSDFKRELRPSIGGMPELGWALTPSAHGKGYATEALKAAIAWGDQYFGEQAQTVCLIDPGNVASLRVAAKCGYREKLRTTYADSPVLLFSRTSPIQR